MKTFSSKEIVGRLKIGMNLSSDNALSEALGVSKTTISNWKSRNTIDFPLVFSKCKQISADWLLTGDGPMLKSDSNNQVSKLEDQDAPPPIVSYNPNIGVPYYDVDFIAGFDLIFNDQTIIPTSNVVVYGFEQAQLWCNATGNSMWPKINHGDMIALKECTLDDVQFGEIYAVVLDAFRTIKILRKSDDPQKMRYIPINSKEYDEQEFDNSRIIRIFEVLGNISKFM